MKKWHLSAQAPHLTQISIKSLRVRNLSRRSPNASMTILFQSLGSFQSSSMTDHPLGFGKSTTLRRAGSQAKQCILGWMSTGVLIHPLLKKDGLWSMSNTSSFLCPPITSFCLRSTGMLTPFHELLFIHWQPSIFHLLSEFVFVCLVCVNLNRVIPGIDVPDHPAIIRDVSRGAEKHACHVG